MIKKMFKKTAVLMAGVVLVMAIATPAFCEDALSVNDENVQASLNADEVEQLETRAMDNTELMEINSGSETTDSFWGAFIVTVGIIALLAVIAGG